MEDINNFRQNHPELVVDDLSCYVDADIIRHSLKYRGIYKWLRVRRLLIQLKHRWLDDIKNLQDEKVVAKEVGEWARYYKLQGMVEALTDCRQQVRALCHSPRDVNFPSHRGEFGGSCKLPDNFPPRPHKRWFCKV